MNSPSMAFLNPRFTVLYEGGSAGIGLVTVGGGYYKENRTQSRAEDSGPANALAAQPIAAQPRSAISEEVIYGRIWLDGT